MDLLALGNSAANFLLYCLMSTQFRATLAKMLRLEVGAGGQATAQAVTATRREVGEGDVFSCYNFSVVFFFFSLKTKWQKIKSWPNIC